MKKKEERKYFDQEWADMKSHLKSFFKKAQQEDLHRFRVQVKKLRAFLILSDSMGGHPKLVGYFKPVNKIFKQAGEIRNAYINQELGNTWQIHDDAFMNSQRQLELRAGRKFKSNKVRFLERLKVARRLLKRKIKPVSDLYISRFYQTRLEQIGDYLAILQFNDSLHQCRKQVKILIHNYKLAHTVPGIGFNEDYLEQVQAAIGDWHDHVLAIKLFSNVAIDQAPVNRLKKQITVLTKDFYNQATTVTELPVEQIS